MKIHVCDICGRDIYTLPKKNHRLRPVRIKMKRYDNTLIGTWDKVEICTICAENIYTYCKENCKNLNGGN